MLSVLDPKATFPFPAKLWMDVPLALMDEISKVPLSVILLELAIAPFPDRPNVAPAAMLVTPV